MEIATNKQEAFTIAGTMIDGDYEYDAECSQGAGYPIYTTKSGDWISDLGNSLEVNKKNGKTTMIDIEPEKKETKSEILGISAEQVNENTFIISLINGKKIEVIKDAEHKSKDSTGNVTTTTWAYKIDSQYFDKFEHAYSYIRILITEKLTGNRIIYHEQGKIPALCGCKKYLTKHAHDGKGCQAQRTNQFSALCSDCPIAEQLQAEQNGVKLVYAIK